jgi:hypothetical protein
MTLLDKQLLYVDTRRAGASIVARTAGVYMANQAARLRQSIQQLVDGQPDNARLRDHLEGLARDEAFSGLTWFWGPLLYGRNRVMFRPLIVQRFSDWETTGGHWRRVPWAAHADLLESWLNDCRRNRDTQLVRRLLRWKYAAKGWGLDNKQFRAALLAAYRAATGPAARAVVLDEFDDWFELDENTALALYEIDRASGPFLHKHLPQSFWGGDKRNLWNRLYAAAERAGDEKLQFTLYRKQQPVSQWTADVLHLANRVSNPDKLNDELLKRHPEGYALSTGDTLIKLLERRGTDVFSYVRAKLADAFGGWWGSDSAPLAALAESKGWWDLWAAAIRVHRENKLFNQAVARLAEDRTLPERQRRSRLTALAGVSQEWNFAGVGFARVHNLEDRVAALLYRRDPDLVRGPFRAHSAPTWWHGFPLLLKAAQAAGDEDVVDLLASRYATRSTYGNRRDDIVEAAKQLAGDYQALRDRDPATFARRAANVLTRIPTYSIHGLDRLLETNQLARLLIVRSFEAFLMSPAAVRDLVEGSDIHVQMLAYRVLAQDDSRARQMAVDSLDILLGTLLRPLHRKTRLAAFAALANAARGDSEAARRVLTRAREALGLPDKKYPKEQLVGLIGQVLHARSELRGPREHPVIFGLQEAEA